MRSIRPSLNSDPVFNKMTSIVHYPRTRIGEFVECLYLNKADSLELNHRNTPLFNQELCFHSGDVFEVKGPQKSTAESMTSWVSGIQTVPTTTCLEGRHLSIGVLFKPWGFYQGFGIHAKEISNRLISSALIFNRSLEDFVKENAGTLPHRDLLFSLEKQLLNFYKPKKVNHKVISLVKNTDAIRIEKGTISQLSDQLGISSKTFIDTFNTTIGITPVKYFHLKKVQQSIREMNNNPEKSLTDICFECDFYDQSHFIRVFSSFCGIAPNEYRKEIRAFL